MQSETKKAILLRSARKPSFVVVPEHAIKMFDRVIEQTSAEAIAAHPDDRWGQIAFWKAIVTVYYHEYIASLLRGDGGLETDPYGFDDVPSYGGESRAQHDAYMACSASLA
jgi:hypothetical protein